MSQSFSVKMAQALILHGSDVYKLKERISRGVGMSDSNYSRLLELCKERACLLASTCSHTCHHGSKTPAYFNPIPY